jgi:transcriptional regulator with XRE-family HTH domain
METTLGDYLRDLRNNRDLSLRELAKLIDKSPSMISEIESGNRFPSEDMMTALARALRTTVENLKQYDSRPRKREVNELVSQNPELGWVFRTVVDKAKAGAQPRDLKGWLEKMPDNFSTEENPGDSQQ